jgi:hypothetical protein
MRLYMHVHNLLPARRWGLFGYYRTENEQKFFTVVGPSFQSIKKSKDVLISQGCYSRTCKLA